MRSYVSAAAVVALGWFSFVRDERPPILGWVSFGVHEFGHLLFAWAPQLVTALMGNGTESLLPLVAAAAFVWFQRDWVAAGLCLAWCATTLQDASVYIADAPYQALPLFKENSIHDWAYILGAEHFWALDKADEIASGVWWAGVVILVAGFACCLAPLVLAASRRAPESGDTLDPGPRSSVDRAAVS